MDWTDVFKDAIGGYANVEIAKAQQPQNPYVWGQPGYGQPMMTGSMGGMGNMMPLILLAGAGVLALVLLRD